MPLILGANSVSGYTVKNSLRFNSGSSDNLSRTPASATNRKTWTWSAWVKKVSNPATFTSLLEVGTGAAVYTTIAFNTSEQLVLASQDEGSGGVMNVISSAVLRDVSAWYHIVVAVDTTQATASDRVKGWINGQQITSFSTASYPTQNRDTYVNNTNVHYIGRRFGGTYFNGYMSEIYLIDGQALTPSSFGETDTDTGIWKPKKYTGTFGTNGFYLEFQNSSALGTDSSGNSNTWTVNNLTSIDQTTDTPTNNFATFNSLTPTSSFGTNTYSEGNLQTTSTSTTSFNDSTIFVSKGKWYCEFKPLANWTSATNNYIGAVSLLYSSNGDVRDDITTTAGLFNTYTNGDIIGLALNMDASPNTCEFFKNGVSQGTVTQNLSSTTTERQFRVRQAVSGMSTAVNFGNAPFTIVSGNADANGYGNFEYAVPSGYYALCTKNLYQYGF